MNNNQRTRREFVVESSLAVAVVAGAGSALLAADRPAGSRQATGVRVGEISDTSAIVRVRITAHETRNNKGLLIPGRANGKKPEQLAKVTVPVEELEGACPGAAGLCRVRYGTMENLGDAVATEWVDVAEESDFSHQFRLTNLKPATVYHYTSETGGPGGKPEHAPLRGTFETAPAADSIADVRFCVMTCQGYPDRGHPDGHGIYPSMRAVKPQFACLTGDLVYYDNDEPRAITPRLARYHWERMFSLPRLLDFTRSVGTYWLKDDHDTLNDDAWPGRNLGELTFAEGQAIFRQQAPIPEGLSYRTIRWGRDLQIWFTDGRDFHSPNTMPDGPGKTIWGEVQKAWFKKTVKASDATWKVLVSPTPLVGPDRKNKRDNHSNAAFRHEGDEIRGWLKANVPDNFFVVCGDRHWQYHSVHPQTGLNEFSVGPASDEHAAGTPGEDKAIHKFHRVTGGFLVVNVSRDGDLARIAFELRGVDGKIGYEWNQTRRLV
jgi:alkaline phosphatase D